MIHQGESWYTDNGYVVQIVPPENVVVLICENEIVAEFNSFSEFADFAKDMAAIANGVELKLDSVHHQDQ
jgi:hypothetical protein